MVDFMLNVFITQNNNNKKKVGDEYVYGIVCGVVSWMYTYLQTHPIVYNKYAWLFVCQSYLNKVTFS